MNVEFVSFEKIARYSRDIVITEKIDGTNAQILITDDGDIFAGSRNRFITPDADNFGFAGWVDSNKAALLNLGPGRHFGEWWGSGIQRRYGLEEKRFSLFNVHRWNNETPPDCCYVVPVLYSGNNTELAVMDALRSLAENGSRAAPGFMNPEGVMIYHTAARIYFKKTIEGDEVPKSLIGKAAQQEQTP